MGLLTQDEKQNLVKDALVLLPGIANRLVRDQLLDGLSVQMKQGFERSAAALTDLQAILNAVDGDQQFEPTDGDWPVFTVIDNARFIVDDKSPLGKRLIALEDRFRARAKQWEVAAALPLGTPESPQNIERRINDEFDFINPEQLVALIVARMRTVCRVDINKEAMGTGFLIGPSTVITNYHVMEDIIKGTTTPDKVRLLFDYKEGPDGLPVPDPQPYSLAPGDSNYLLVYSPYEGLDYAVLRVDGSPGNDPASGKPGNPTRGWLEPKSHEFRTGEPVAILQHPQGDPLRVTWDLVTKLYGDLNRVAYKANTDYCSSGSPCFTLNDWELVALHQGFFDAELDPEEPNKGIPFKYILKNKKVVAAIGK